MKKIVFLLLIVIIPLKAFNQISQGSLIIGGEFSLSLSKDKREQNNQTSDGPTNTYFRFSPNIEYLLADNLSAGLGLGYSLNREKTETTNTETIDKNGNFEIKPYLRKYFTLGDRAFIFGEAAALFSFGKSITEYKTNAGNTSTESSGSGISIGLSPGLRYNISDKLALETKVGFVGFNHSVGKSGVGANERRDITNTFGFSISPNMLSFGIRYTLN